MWSLRKVTASDAIFENAKSIRKQVFVEEQGVPETLEYDEYEAHSSHFLVFDQKKAVATARWRRTKYGIKLERFAVLPHYRGKGIGKFLVLQMIQEVKSLSDCIYLNAQIQVVSFFMSNYILKEWVLFLKRQAFSITRWFLKIHEPLVLIL